MLLEVVATVDRSAIDGAWGRGGGGPWPVTRARLRVDEDVATVRTLHRTVETTARQRLGPVGQEVVARLSVNGTALAADDEAPVSTLRGLGRRRDVTPPSPTGNATTNSEDTTFMV